MTEKSRIEVEKTGITTSLDSDRPKKLGGRVKADPVDKTMKKKTILLPILSLLVSIGLLFGGRSYYLDHYKYAILEKEIRKIHAKIEADASTEFLAKIKSEYLVGEISFPSSYDVGDQGTMLTKEFEKAGIVNEDKWAIVKETFIRSKKGVPFKLHRLIMLENKVYASHGDKAVLKQVSEEFYIYRHYKGKLQ